MPPTETSRLLEQFGDTLTIFAHPVQFKQCPFGKVTAGQNRSNTAALAAPDMDTDRQTTAGLKPIYFLSRRFALNRAAAYSL